MEHFLRVDLRGSTCLAAQLQSWTWTGIAGVKRNERLSDVFRFECAAGDGYTWAPQAEVPVALIAI